MEVLWDGDGAPPERRWDQWKHYGIEIGYPPPKGHGTSESIMGWRWGTPQRPPPPPPPPVVRKLKTFPSIILWMRAVTNAV